MQPHAISSGPIVGFQREEISAAFSAALCEEERGKKKLKKVIK